MTDDERDRYLTTREVAIRLGWSQERVRYHVSTGRIPSIRSAGDAQPHHLIHPDTLELLERTRDMLQRSIAGEEWRAIPQWLGLYEASSEGRVRLVTRYRHKRPGEILATFQDKGYLYVSLRPNGDIARKQAVHRLVAAAFHGECPDGMTVNHKDAVKTNNRPGNLEYLSRGDNARHAMDLGLYEFARGDASGARKYPERYRGLQRINSKLSEEAVREIRRRVLMGETQASVARSYQVTASLISHICSRRKWGYVS